jgi:hypothetical protein
MDFHVDFPQLLDFIPLESHPPVTNRNGVVSFQLDWMPEIRIRQITNAQIKKNSIP